MSIIKSFGMELNLHCECIKDFNKSSISDILAALIHLYSNFESKKVSYPINLDFEDGNGKTKKIKFKNVGNLINVDGGSDVVMAHWYIYDNSEYDVVCSHDIKSMHYNEFMGNKVITRETLATDKFKLDLQGSGDSVFEQTGVFWLDNGELKSKIWDINLLNFKGKYSKTNKLIKSVSEEIKETLCNENSTNVSGIRRVYLENAKSSMYCDLFRDDCTVTKVIAKIDVEADADPVIFDNKFSADKHLQSLLNDVLADGFEVISDISM